MSISNEKRVNLEKLPRYQEFLPLPRCHRLLEAGLSIAYSLHNGNLLYCSGTE